jgi:DNA primase
VFDLLRDRHADGRSVQLGGLANILTPEEMCHLARVTDKPEHLGHSQQSLMDYINIIRMERIKRQSGSDEDLLRAAMEKHKKLKAYGGE